MAVEKYFVTDSYVAYESISYDNYFILSEKYN